MSPLLCRWLLDISEHKKSVAICKNCVIERNTQEEDTRSTIGCDRKKLPERCTENSTIVNPINVLVANAKDSKPVGLEGWSTTYYSGTRPILQMSLKFLLRSDLSHIMVLLLEMFLQICWQAWSFVGDKLKYAETSNSFAVVTTKDPSCHQAIYPLQGDAATRNAICFDPPFG
jgi:hypothetical protein